MKNTIVLSAVTTVVVYTLLNIIHPVILFGVPFIFWWKYCGERANELEKEKYEGENYSKWYGMFNLQRVCNFSNKNFFVEMIPPFIRNALPFLEEKSKGE